MDKPIKVAVASLGAIGSRVAKSLSQGDIPGINLCAVATRNVDKARITSNSEIPVLALSELANHADIVVECLPASEFDKMAVPTIEKGKKLIVLTGSALLERPSLIERAKQTGARILVPSGAMIGLDGINATNEGQIHSVKIQTVKPPMSLANSPYVKAQNLNLETLDSALCIYSGSVRQAARHFPANMNVAAAISLAGIGADQTMLEIWADPDIDANTHKVTVESDASSYYWEVKNTPSAENPATGIITPQSVLALLRGLVNPLKIGT